MNKRVAALVVASALALSIGGGLVAQAASRPPRGNCAKVGSNAVHNIALTSAGKCPTGWWGPVATGANGAPGVKGDVGPKGDKGDVGPAGPQGEKGAAGPQGLPGKDGADGKPASCPDPFAIKDVTVADAAEVKANAAALKAAQDALVVAQDAAAEAADDVTDAQTAYGTAAVADKPAKLAALVNAVKAKDAADAVVVAKQAAANAASLKAATPALYVIRACVKAAA